MSRLNRTKLRRRKKWIVFSIVGLLCLLILLIIFYRWVQDDLWTEREQVIQQVSLAVEFEEVLKAERFHDDETFWVITGTDLNGDEQMVWWDAEHDKLLYETSPGDGITPKEAEQNVLSKQPDAKIIRVLPARYQGAWGWEVFYRYQEEPKKTRYAYDYYNFEDGEHLGSLNLAPEMEN